ncbi:DUF6188 family protein [Streptomyces sp. RPT161]|uniref:DUF6188 family protein n=1 Tax=Streptomyces sp. RPT161 TaxID=3015993 RepID=UPI003FCEE559
MWPQPSRCSRQTVLSAVAFKPGTLRMVFDGGTHLTCPADVSFKTWQVPGPGG